MADWKPGACWYAQPRYKATPSRSESLSPRTALLPSFKGAVCSGGVRWHRWDRCRAWLREPDSVLARHYIHATNQLGINLENKLEHEMDRSQA